MLNLYNSGTVETDLYLHRVFLTYRFILTLKISFCVNISKFVLFFIGLFLPSFPPSDTMYIIFSILPLKMYVNMFHQLKKKHLRGIRRFV